MLGGDRCCARHRIARLIAVSHSARNASYDAIACYREAVAREVELSSFWGRYFGLEGALLDVPNGFSHHALLRRFAPAVRALMGPARAIWVFAGLPVLALGWALRWSLAPGWDGPVTSPSRAYLHASNDRNVNFVPPEVRPSTAITLPWRPLPAPGAWATTRLDLRALSTRLTVWRAAWDSIRAGLQLWSSPDRRSVLFTYSAPSWFWAAATLRGCALDSIWISNHVDRWASLATTLPGVRTTMVQHGDLGHLDVRSGNRLVPRLAQPLRGVAQVFVTDDGSVADFIAAVTGAGPVFTRIELGMHVVPWTDAPPDVLRVLIIGHPDAQPAIGRLARDVDAQVQGAVRIAYRPHPTESRPVVLPFVASERVTITAGGETVPAVDVVVSYGSSVTGEIVAATGARLVHWDPNDAESARATADALVRCVMTARPSPTPVQG
jgi:hypothetical protein